MTSLLVNDSEDYSENIVWKSWQLAKQRTWEESWAKENSRMHWRTMIDEAKAECAWMVELQMMQIRTLEAKIEKYRAAGQGLAETVELLIKLINYRLPTQ